METSHVHPPVIMPFWLIDTSSIHKYRDDFLTINHFYFKCLVHHISPKSVYSTIGIFPVLYCWLLAVVHVTFLETWWSWYLFDLTVKKHPSLHRKLKHVLPTSASAKDTSKISMLSATISGSSCFSSCSSIVLYLFSRSALRFFFAILSSCSFSFSLFSFSPSLLLLGCAPICLTFKL